MLHFDEKLLENYTFIDLFAGVGGFHIALESLGAKCVYASEIDEHAKDVYENNFGNRPDGDITKVDENSIPDHDILCAGFPCQAFSICGNKLGFEDSRGTLFFDVARIVKAKKPKIVFMENVKNLKSHDKGNTFSVIKNTMEDLGYQFNAKVLDSSKFNVPQKRERIYMVCVRDDIAEGWFNFPWEKPLTKHVEDILEKDPVPCQWWGTHDMMWTGNSATEYSDKPVRIGIVNDGSQGNRVYSIKGVGITLTSNGGGRYAKTGGYLIDCKTRRLTPRECARMMGFPDTFKISDMKGQVYQQFGNSVVVDMIQEIGVEIGLLFKRSKS